MYIPLCDHFGVMVCIYHYVITLGLWFVYTAVITLGLFFVYTTM